MEYGADPTLTDPQTGNTMTPLEMSESNKAVVLAFHKSHYFGPLQWWWRLFCINQVLKPTNCECCTCWYKSYTPEPGDTYTAKVQPIEESEDEEDVEEREATERAAQIKAFADAQAQLAKEVQEEADAEKLREREAEKAAAAFLAAEAEKEAVEREQMNADWLADEKRKEFRKKKKSSAKATARANATNAIRKKSGAGLG